LAYIGTKPTIGNFQICDAISVVNGQAAYTMQVGGVNVSPQSASHMIVSLNGTIQKPNSSFTVSGSTITFASNLATGDVIDFIQILGDVLDLGVPSDATVSTAKLADNAVTAAKITDSTITAAKLASGTVQNQSAFKNIIINGDMSIAQRGTSATGKTATGYYTSDRFQTSISSAGTWTQSQSTDVPTGQGFATSLKLDCTTANGSLSSGSELVLRQMIEGQNLQYLKKGTANAESTTISFWVKSNKTGTYIVEIDDNDNSRNINKSYTISSADTWEKKTITFAGDTSGALGNDNGSSFRIMFWLAAGTDFTSGTLATSWESTINANRAVGQVNLADSTSNEWYVTGVQLEAGTAASDFEFLPVDVNLARCQRYYYLHVDGASSNKRVFSGGAYNSTLLDGTVFFPTTMRANPSIDVVSGTDYYRAYGNGTSDAVNDFVIEESNINSAGVRNNTNFSGNQGDSYFVITQNSSAKLAFNSEL
jgi:hypothetical protein